jgi:phosphomannomutase
VRVMVEGQDQAEVRQMAEQIAQAVAAAAPV